MFQPNQQDSPSTTMQVDQRETSIVVKDEPQNGGLAQAQSIIHYTQKLEDGLHSLGLKIRHHEDNIKLLKGQTNKLDESILDMQVLLGKYPSTIPPNTENNDHSTNPNKEEINEQILHYENSAAGIFCQIKTRYGNQASRLTLTKDVLGIVATLAKVDDDNLSRILSEYLGVDSMLAFVCKTQEGAKALETYDREGHINKDSGIHGLGASIGRALDGRFVVICLENLRPYCGQFVADDPQRRLDLIKPKLSNGETPPGFIGFAVNMIHVEPTNLLYVAASGHGLRETLFYYLFSHLQVYKTRAEMMFALPCLTGGAISLDGGMIKCPGIFLLGSQKDVVVRFPKPYARSNLHANYTDTERQLKEMKWKKEKLLEDMKREQALLDAAKRSFGRKKEEFLKFLAQSSSYTIQHQNQAAQERFTPR